MKDEWQEEITPAHIEKFLAVHGRHGAKTLSMLGKGNPFYQAITDPVGQVLLQDLMIAMEPLLDLIIADKATEKQRAEYRVYIALFEKWTKKIADQRKLKSKVRGDK